MQYAMEAISHAGTALGVLGNQIFINYIAKDGIVLAAEKKMTSKLLEQDSSASEKLYVLNEQVMNQLTSQ